MILVTGLALPNYLGAPPQISQCSVHAAIALQRFAKFVLPKRGSGLRSGCAPASIMAMPKTAVNKQRDPSRGKDEIRCTG